MAKLTVSVNTSNVWHPNTQMSEWNDFPEITKAKGVWLYEKSGNKMIDGVASMWCNVWGHSKKELINSITSQTKKLQPAPMFNLTNKPVEKLAKKLVKILGKNIKTKLPHFKMDIMEILLVPCQLDMSQNFSQILNQSCLQAFNFWCQMNTENQKIKPLLIIKIIV